MEVTVEEAKRDIKILYEKGHRESILLLGPAGVGKSVMVKELAEELAEEQNREFIDYSDDVLDEILRNPDKYFVYCDIRLTEVEPADLIGIPREHNGYVTYRPLGWGRALSVCPGILFLDEITNVQRLDVQAAMYKLLLDRKVGFVKLHKDVLVVAAGNRPEDSALAVPLPAPAINRVLKLTIRPPKLEEWMEWMYRKYGNDWDQRVLGFLKKFSQYFLQKPEAETLDQFATPRKWTNLALISHKIPMDVLEAIVEGEVGKEAATHFMAFIKINIPELEEIIRHPEIYLKLDSEQRYFVIVQMSSFLMSEMRKQNVDLNALLKKLKRFFLTLLNNDKENLMLLLSLLPYEDRFNLVKQMTFDKELDEIPNIVIQVHSKWLKYKA